ncbi:cardio acceleratory peptide capability [Anticarsia gemmatalis]|uniref:cardio acceleratory peptide capability n=1 Tax=Anticarsia gemmatalis TaxID=129554 RepID=UPI003F767871
MQPTMRIFVSLFLFSSALASAYHSSVKLRRDGVLNLYPFPRVGRASRNTWQLPLNDLYLEYEPSEKRQLYAFPRVGRSDLSLVRGEPAHEYAPMPVRRTESPGMWFGPRLGRSFKSDDDDLTIQNERSEHSDPEQTEPLHGDRKKRQAN